MRWIDIDLPEAKISQEATILLQEAERLADGIPGLQDKEGLDARAVTDQMRAAGRLLFQAVVLVDREAFSPEPDRTGAHTPGETAPEAPGSLGYHLVVGANRLHLPWFWLHNGIEFLAAKHPLCWAETGSSPETAPIERPWMDRFTRAGFVVGSDGDTSRAAILQEMQGDRLGPELLFVPGHSEETIRRLIYREAEAIEHALSSTLTASPLARLKMPAEAVTPSRLPELGWAYQAMHFAGPTSQPARQTDTVGEYWMNRLIEETATPSDEDYEEAVGLEGEVLGVDPITSLLDDVCEKYDAQGGPSESLNRVGERAEGASGGGRDRPRGPGQQWLLPDGPIDPEHIGRQGLIPPLVFSNSYRALPELGRRFTTAGASAFVGPLVPLFSRPARLFAGHCYRALGQGRCVGAAVWQAADACRRELGDEHPAWLSYGVQGYGALALQYL